jgi:hypothetical protein
MNPSAQEPKCSRYVRAKTKKWVTQPDTLQQWSQVNTFYNFFPDTLHQIGPITGAFGQVFMSASIFMLVTLTYERHFAICSPNRYRIHILTTSRWKHLALYVVPVTILSFLFNIPTFLNLDVSTKDMQRCRFTDASINYIS